MVKNFAQGWLAALVIGAATFLLYSINLERLPDGDELYHALAAQGLLETGEPSIGEHGRYWRGYPTTWLVAHSYALFGPSLTAARLPSVLLMTALVVGLFVFMRRETSATAAWIGAGLFAVSPFALAVAQFARFYSLQGLAFFIAAWLVYRQIGQPWPLWRHVAAAVPAALLLAFAVYLQPTTLLGIAGLGLWAIGALLLPWLVDSTVPARVKLYVVAGLLVTGLVAAMAAWALGLVDALWMRYRSTMLFNELQGENFLFYHLWYMLYYPTLWTLSGILAVLALIDRPRLAGFALTIFVTGFLLNSFAAAKSLRYIFY
ncbi:ArnT family glycosyltransferase, partial [Blastomonas sp.]|uniref:ArnT family glycosyltransferase n=1 Tax=Blastomonas sp. TaxID=1909299 RepID=UPI0035945FF5